MPNYCDNRLTIDKPRTLRLEFARQLFITMNEDEESEAPSLLATLHPMPEELHGIGSGTELSDDDKTRLTATYGHSNWYDWAMENWGTKWADEGLVLHSVDPLTLVFATAWTPPLAGLTHISSLWPNLRFTLEYAESGVGFSGTATFQNRTMNDTYTMCLDTSWAAELGYADEPA